jgi:hypothetical protein
LPFLFGAAAAVEAKDEGHRLSSWRGEPKAIVGDSVAGKKALVTQSPATFFAWGRDAMAARWGRKLGRAKE